jgi:hypothetical protein
MWKRESHHCNFAAQRFPTLNRLLDFRRTMLRDFSRTQWTRPHITANNKTTVVMEVIFCRFPDLDKFLSGCVHTFCNSGRLQSAFSVFVLDG